MEIFDQITGLLQANVSNKYPMFTVGGLDAGKLLKINIFAANGKGKSDTVTMEAFTLKAAEKQTGMIISFVFFRHQTLLPSMWFFVAINGLLCVKAVNNNTNKKRGGKFII